MVTLALAVVGVARGLTASGGAGVDFLSFYAAGDIVRHGGAGLYDARAQDATARALYPGTLDYAAGYPLPVFVAWMFAPLSMLPYGAAFALWDVVNLGLLAGFAVALHHVLADVPAVPRRILLAVFVFSVPTMANIVFGQVDLVIFSALLAAYALLRRDRHMAAGVVLALVLIKPPFLLGIVPMLAMQRRWGVLLALCAAGVPLLTLPALLTSPDTLLSNLTFIAHYPSASGRDLQVNAAMMSNFRGLVVSTTGRDEAWLWLPGMIVIGGGAFAIAARRWWRGGDPAQAFGLAVLLPLLASPHLHTQSLVLLFVPVTLALRARFDGEHAASARLAATDATIALLALYSALCVLWLSTALGFAPMFFLVAAVFAATAFRWPVEDGAQAAVGAPDVDVPLRMAS